MCNWRGKVKVKCKNCGVEALDFHDTVKVYTREEGKHCCLYASNLDGF